MAMKSELDLEITREIDAPPALIWKAWTEPELLVRWWAPRPIETKVLDMDVRPGGAFNTVMYDPEGNEYPCGGCYLEVIENQRLAWTDALEAGFRPSKEPFFTAILTLADLGGGRTLYTARAVHGTEENRIKHEEMGFFDGWGTALNQLVALLPELGD